MKIEESKLRGCFLIIPSLFEDKRGYFFESFNKKNLEKHIGYSLDFVQDNQSQSNYGVIRGLHLQRGEESQAKLVRVIQGEILDVIIDLRPNSSTYGKHDSFILNESNKHQLFVPKDFAHGFIVLSKKATIHYKADGYYAPLSESGIIYNDKDLNIDWKLPADDVVISEKDLLLPTLREFINGK